MAEFCITYTQPQTITNVTHTWT